MGWRRNVQTELVVAAERMGYMGQELLKAHKFTVERCSYRINGRTVERELVVHPGAVAILPLLDNGQVVMIRNYRFSVGAELLELPAGTLEVPEPPIECAARELVEETGYVASHLELLCSFYTSPGFTNERMFVFVATGLRFEGARPEADEQIRVVTMPLDDAFEATADGRIMDGKTIAALQVYRYRQSRSQGQQIKIT